MSATIPLARYLFTRLQQLGVATVFGVPGDYNLDLLDHLEPSGLDWVGNCNELNASYAADGYSRIKGIGALITTFGVGELSAINGVAGAYTELARVVHIVGTPSRGLQEAGTLLHHTLLDGNYRHFAQIYEHVSVAQANLVEIDGCTQLIDSTLQHCLAQSRPVYIQLPMDMVSVPIPAAGLDLPITLPETPRSSVFDSALELVLSRISCCKRPMILVDGECAAYGILDNVDKFIRLSSWPTWTSVFGKGYVDETLPNVFGVWKGPFTSESERHYIESVDLLLCFGPHFSGTNTYTFSTVPDPRISVLVSATSVHADSQIFKNVCAKQFLSALLSRYPSQTAHGKCGTSLTIPEATKLAAPGNGLLSQVDFYQYMASWLQPCDVVLAETGTAGHGCRDMRLPPGVQLLKPVTWLSIGYMLPATLGVALAQRDVRAIKASSTTGDHVPPRALLLIGDGSFQMTAQEISTIIRQRLNVLIVLINNNGYTIERCIHGRKASYNDVAAWKYLESPALFGASATEEVDDYQTVTSRAETWSDLESALRGWSKSRRPSLHMIEAIMGQEDAPEALLALLDAQKQNVR